jgi:hypothetical protein
MNTVEMSKEIISSTANVMHCDKSKCNMRVVVRMIEQLKSIDKCIGVECESVIKREFLIVLIGAFKGRLKEKDRKNYDGIIATLSHLQSQLDGANDWKLYILIDKHYSLIANNKKAWISFLMRFCDQIYVIMRTRSAIGK